MNNVTDNVILARLTGFVKPEDPPDVGKFFV